MKLEEAKKILLEFIRCAGEEFEKVKFTSTSMNVDDGDIEAMETVIAELHAMQNLLDEKREEIEHLQKENEELQKENGKLTRARKWFIEHTVGEIATPEMLRKILANEYIHKDKIREKIKEITDKYNRIYKFPSPKVEETPEGQLIYKIRFNTDSEELRIVKIILEELVGGE